nr:MAG TPA: 4Fe-4S single cluster domain protein [Caudoviricetes sp.]
MKYLSITHVDQLNGDGNRVVLWVSGCSHHCKNCQNKFSWDPEAGKPFDDKAREEIFKDLSEDWCAGLTFSGGDPLFETNRRDVISFAKLVKEKFPSKSIWLYTGYTYDEVLGDKTMSPILEYIDVLCDGEYIDDLKDLDKHWVGSSNQNVIAIK